MSALGHSDIAVTQGMSALPRLVPQQSAFATVRRGAGILERGASLIHRKDALRNPSNPSAKCGVPHP